MAHRNCFETPSDKLSSSDYMTRKKARTLYKASVNLANQPIPGVYQKNTSIGGIGAAAKKKGTRSNGIYVGDIFIGSGQTVSTPAGGKPQTNGDSKGCLIGAKSYEALLSVTVGKYLVDPINFDFRRDQSIWVGSLYQMDYSGAQTIVSNPQWPVNNSSTNTFKYPPGSSQNQSLPIDASNSNIGLIVDYSYNIFYPQSLSQSARGACYLKNELSYKQFIKCLPYNKVEAGLYYRAAGGYIGDFNYPKKFHFDCNESWINDISLCLTQPRGNGQ